MAINGRLHTRGNVARLYLARKEVERALISIKECVRRESKSLHGYPRESTEWMLKAALKPNPNTQWCVCPTNIR